MNNNINRFINLLKNYQTLEKAWDFEKMEYRPKIGNQIMSIASTHEKLVLQFLVKVWVGATSPGVGSPDFIAISELSADWKRPILGWLKDPFFP